jgi:hypothetical protein
MLDAAIRQAQRQIVELITGQSGTPGSSSQTRTQKKNVTKLSHDNLHFLFNTGRGIETLKKRYRASSSGISARCSGQNYGKHRHRQVAHADVKKAAIDARQRPF